MSTATGTSELREYRVTSNKEISPEVYVISVKRDFDFAPGQVIKLALDRESPPRIYSLCSGNRDIDASVLFNIKQTGSLTPRLASSKPGDKILMSAPYGSFTGDSSAAWWIGTGTGIAPYYSMLRSGLGSNKKLIHGVKYLNQFYFGDELARKMGENYIRCCSRESATGVFSGRITTYIEEMENLPDLKYFLCGNALMVVEVRDLLISRGIPFEKIVAEIYF
jgi:ferredoxin/flavodoxin---NADP+ reductase